MFGTVRPRPCSLPDVERQRYRRLYCGTCKGLGSHFGTHTRPILSYDAVLLAAVVDGLTDEPAEDASCRCPLNPLAFRPTLDHDSTPMRMAASVQLALADEWLADHAADGTALWNTLRLALPRGSVDLELRTLGVDAPLQGLSERQNRVERPGVTTPAEAAEPTAVVLEHLFGGLVDLEDVASPLVVERRRLRRMGRALGTCIYLLDALEDLQRDARNGTFNPCLRADHGNYLPCSDRVRETEALLLAASEQLGADVAALPWRRNRALLEHAIGDALPSRIAGAVAAARSASSAPAVNALVHQRRLPVLQRWWMSATAALAAMWRIVSNTDPSGHKKRRGNNTPDCSACDCSGCCDPCCRSDGPDGCDGCDVCSGCDGCGGCDCSC